VTRDAATQSAAAARDAATPQAPATREAAPPAPAPAGADSIVVSPGGAYPTLLDGLRAASKASDGRARVHVAPGTYALPDDIALAAVRGVKSWEIAGLGDRGAIVIDGSAAGCFTIDMRADPSQTVAIRGLTIRNGGATRAAILVGSGRLTLEDCAITSSARACLQVGPSSDAAATVRRCAISGPAEQPGVMVAGGTARIEEDCKISECGVGVEARDRGSVTIAASRVTANRGSGVYVHHGATATLDGALLLDNGRSGLWLVGGEATLTRCRVRNNAQYGARCEGDGSRLALVETQFEGNRLGDVDGDCGLEER
jgi:hypothetical protein